MEVTLQQVSKRFGAQRVLKDTDLHLPAGSITGVTGPNGSGKSTLLQIIAGAIIPDNGEVIHMEQGQLVESDLVFRKLSIAAPYLNLYEDLKLDQALTSHTDFKKLSTGIGANEFFGLIELEHARHKRIRDLSSGMTQRLKLGLAILSDTSLLLLDEPGSNLDAQGIEWYHSLLQRYRSTRTVLVCSNREKEELKDCEQVISVIDL